MAAAAEGSLLDAHRPRLVIVCAVISLAVAPLLAFKLLPADLGGVYLAIVVTIYLTCVPSIVLALRGFVSAAVWFLLIGLALGILLAPAATHDLNTVPFWLGPFCAIALLVLPRGSELPTAIMAVGILVVLGVVASPSEFVTPTYNDLLSGGVLVSLTTACIGLYAVWSRNRELATARELSMQADAMLAEVQQARAELEARVAERERSLTGVLTEKDALIADLEDLVVRDPRTGLFNGRHLADQWPLLVSESIEANLPIAVVALDLDHFGRINKDYSHERGDRVLEQFAGLIRQHIRGGDIPYRLGQGEEFLVVLPHTHDRDAADVAERIRVACRRAQWTGLPDYEHLTVSAGVSERSAHGDEVWESLLARADAALLSSKREGRDRVTIAAESADA